MDEKNNKEWIKDRFLSLYERHICFNGRPGSDDLLNWLSSTDFFEAPASAKYHGAYEGGLLEHTLNVYDRLSSRLCNERTRGIYSETTVAIVALLHDICKVDFYEKNIITRRKDDGSLEEIPVWGYKNTGFPGHGERSLYMVSRYIDLTEEEAVAIDRHMGPYDRRGYKDLTRIWKEYPLAYHLYMADMEATWEDEILKEPVGGENDETV
jgi:hypothetical protein